MKKIHSPLRLKQVVEYIDSILSTLTYDQLLKVSMLQLDQTWRTWLTASTYNTVNGLDKFTHSTFIPGTTAAFGEFISRYPNRRIRVSRSDFVLTKILSRTYERLVVDLEDGPLLFNDCLIVSFPFSGNGSLYPDVDLVLDQADALGVPVFIDAAYFGISHGVDYPLNRACVQDIAFSLSKNLAGDPLRLGIRFTKHKVDDGASAALLGGDIFDRLGAAISIKLLERYPHDWLVELLMPYNEIICGCHNLRPTNTLTITLGSSAYYAEYSRGDYTRVVISDELSSRA